jgi:6-phosphogluconolactonase (cycloisomerase 2 family)
LLYVLNSDTNDASISGYNVTGDGGMTPIVGSHRPTSDPDGGQPAQITFDSTGKVLAVSERLAGPGGNGLIDTYTIGKDGAAGLPVTHPSTGVDPFAIAFTHDDLMILANEHFPTTDLSSVSTYDLSKDGSVTPVDSKPNPGGACWDVITNDDKYVFIANPFTFNVNSLAIGRNGVLTPVPSSTVVTEGLTFDEALSSDSKFLYVLVDDPNVFAYSEIYEYAVGKDGRLTALGKTARFEGSSAGMAAT